VARCARARTRGQFVGAYAGKLPCRASAAATHWASGSANGAASAATDATSTAAYTGANGQAKRNVGCGVSVNARAISRAGAVTAGAAAPERSILRTSMPPATSRP
jgi:hypothetical protein